MNRKFLTQLLHRLEIHPYSYDLYWREGEDAVYGISHEGDGWHVFFADGTTRTDERVHATEGEACEDLLVRIARDPLTRSVTPTPVAQSPTTQLTHWIGHQSQVELLFGQGWSDAPAAIPWSVRQTRSDDDGTLVFDLQSDFRLALSTPFTVTEAPNSLEVSEITSGSYAPIGENRSAEPNALCINGSLVFRNSKHE
ncbi:MAG: hypothetical protein ACOYN3_07605 [Acidimicrobiia bacterium]